jgi:hypothetical protein
MTAPAEYVREPVHEGANVTIYRGRRHGNLLPVLGVAPTAEQPSPQSLKRLEHEYSLAAELALAPAPACDRRAIVQYAHSNASNHPW